MDSVLYNIDYWFFARKDNLIENTQDEDKASKDYKQKYEEYVKNIDDLHKTLNELLKKKHVRRCFSCAKKECFFVLLHLKFNLFTSRTRLAESWECSMKAWRIRSYLS